MKNAVAILAILMLSASGLMAQSRPAKQPKNLSRIKQEASMLVRHLATPSIDPSADSVAIVKMRLRMDSIRRHRPTVALVLAGGGAKGAAHIGALEYIEELGIPIDMVLGTSMGGLIGGLVAMGYPSHTIDSILTNVNWGTMLSDRIPIQQLPYARRLYNDRYPIRIPFRYEDAEWERRAREETMARHAYEASNHLSSSEVVEQHTANIVANLPDGYLYGYNVNNVINSLTVGYQDSMDFTKLPIPYCCVATDLVDMKAKYWTSGRIADAMRSTMSIPFYFTPVRRDGRILVDGGTRNNFPTDMAHAMGADIIIGVDLSQPRTYSEINGLGTLLLQCINVMGKDAFDNNLPLADVYIHPDMTGFNMMSFDSESISECVRRGHAAAQQHADKLNEIRQRLGDIKKPRATRPTAVNINISPILIGTIRYEGIDDELADYFDDRDNIEIGNRYSSREIEAVMAMMYGSGLFDQVSYSIQGASEPYTLVFHCKRGPIHRFGSALHFDTKTYLSAIINIGINKYKHKGFQAEFTGIIGNNPAATLDISHTSPNTPSFGLSIHTRHQTLELYSAQQAIINHTIQTHTIWYNKVDLYAITHSWRNGSIRIGALYEVQPYKKIVMLTEADPFAPDTTLAPDSSLSPSLKSGSNTYYDGFSNVSSKGWKEYSLSPYLDFVYDNTDDSFFPTKGINLGLRYNYLIHINNYFSIIDNANRTDISQWHLIHGHIKDVIPLGQRLALIPSAYFNINLTHIFSDPTAILPEWYQTSIGGLTPTRFYNNQLPYIGYNLPHFVIYSASDIVANIDLRYQLSPKAYLSLTAAAYSNLLPFDRDDPGNNEAFKMFRLNTITDYTFALKFGYKTFLGPLNFNIHWSRYNEPSHWGTYLSIGHEF